MVLTPILPLVTVANATRKILYAISAGTARSTKIGSAWLTNVWASGTTNVSRPITWCTWATNIGRSIAWSTGTANVGWSITGCARPTDVSRSIAGLAGATDIGSTTGANSITKSAARARGQC
jgi:hypothetical protein